MGRLRNRQYLKGKYAHRKNFGGYIYERRAAGSSPDFKRDILTAIRKHKQAGRFARYTTFKTYSGRTGMILWVGTGKKHSIRSGNVSKRKTSVRPTGYYISSRGRSYKPRLCNGCGRPADYCAATGGC